MKNKFCKHCGNKKENKPVIYTIMIVVTILDLIGLGMWVGHYLGDDIETYIYQIKGMYYKPIDYENAKQLDTSESVSYESIKYNTKGDRLDSFNRIENIYEIEAIRYQNDSLVQNITQKCRNKIDTLLQIECVKKQVSLIYVYNDTNLTDEYRDDYLMMPPSKTITYGMVCRDSVLIYASIFRNLNIPYQIIRVPTISHVFIMAKPRIEDNENLRWMYMTIDGISTLTMYH